MKRMGCILGIPTLGGVIIGAFATYAGAQHNPQGVFNAPGGNLDPMKLLPIFAFWFIVVFLFLAVIGVFWEYIRTRW
jgi:hypothetical protein